MIKKKIISAKNREEEMGGGGGEECGKGIEMKSGRRCRGEDEKPALSTAGQKTVAFNASQIFFIKQIWRLHFSNLEFKPDFLFTEISSSFFTVIRNEYK